MDAFCLFSEHLMVISPSPAATLPNINNILLYSAFCVKIKFASHTTLFAHVSIYQNDT